MRYAPRCNNDGSIKDDGKKYWPDFVGLENTLDKKYENFFAFYSRRSCYGVDTGWRVVGQ